jgi:hypothetical protein
MLEELRLGALLEKRSPLNRRMIVANDFTLVQTKIFKISYYIISEVLKNEMIKRIEVRCTLRSRTTT